MRYHCKSAVLLVFFLILISCRQDVIPVEDNTSQEVPETPQEPADKVQGGPGTMGWTSETVSEGLLLHRFEGYDPVTCARQRVRVLDVDMNSNKYRIEFVLASDKVGSALAKEKGAIASINATFEPQSVYIRVDGIEYHNISNSYIRDTDVPNWKNDGAIYMREDGTVYLEYSGKGMNLAQQRRYYRLHTCPNIFSSAPMLIDNYDPVGENFVPANLTESQLNSYNYEHPYRHQGVTHPRTVFAMTGDNHLLLIAIDKDRTYGTVAGMSARGMTQFLKYHFNPQYALNMDGGGSTALSVRGRLVNTPSDSGERSVPTFLLVYEKK